MHNCQFKHLQAEPSLSYRRGHKERLLDTHSSTTSIAVPSCCLQMMMEISCTSDDAGKKCRWIISRLRGYTSTARALTASSPWWNGSTVVFDVQGTGCVEHWVNKYICFAFLQHVEHFLQRRKWQVHLRKRRLNKTHTDQCLWKLYHLFKSRIVRKSTTVLG